MSLFQHGFRFESQLIRFSQEIFDNLEDGKQTDLIIMDFSKTFDKVDHNLLIYKLFNLGVNCKTVSWIKSFLKNRNQTVVVEGKQSCQVSPKDLYWGPVIFLALINDSPGSLKRKV